MAKKDFEIQELTEKVMNRPGKLYVSAAALLSSCLLVLFLIPSPFEPLSRALILSFFMTRSVSRSREAAAAAAAAHTTHLPRSLIDHQQKAVKHPGLSSMCFRVLYRRRHRRQRNPHPHSLCLYLALSLSLSLQCVCLLNC